MDEELKKLLEDAKSNGASDNDLNALIDMYESDKSVKKKDDLQDTAPRQNSASPTKVAQQPISLATSKPESYDLKTQTKTQDFSEPFTVEKQGDLPNKIQKHKEDVGVWADLTNRFKSGGFTALAGVAGVDNFVAKLTASIVLDKESLAELNKLPQGAREILLASGSPEQISRIQNSAEAQNFLTDKAEKLSEKTIQYEGNIVDDIGNGDYGKASYRVIQGAVESLPSMILALSPGGLATIGASTASQKQEEQDREGADLGLKTVANSVINGTAEAFFEKYTVGIFEPIKKMALGNKEIAKEISENLVKTILKDIGIEGGSEGLTAITQDLSDKLVTGKDISMLQILKNSIDVSIIGGFVGGSMSGVKGYVSTKTRSAETTKKINDNSSMSEALKKELNIVDSESIKNALQAKIEQVDGETAEIQQAELAKVDNLSDEQVKEVFEVDSEMKKINQSFIDLVNDDKMSPEIKRVLEKDLEQKFKTLEAKKSEIVNSKVEEIAKPTTDKNAESIESTVTEQTNNFASQLGEQTDISDVVGGATMVKIGATEVILKDNKDNIVIESIRTDENEKGQGSAKNALMKITDIADEQQKTLELKVVPENESTTEAGLTKLYESFGFEKEGDKMVRKPIEVIKPEIVDVAPINDNKVNEVKKVKSIKDTTYDVTFDQNGNVTKIISPKGNREIPKFIERKIKPTKENPKGVKLVLNGNYSKIESDALGTITSNMANDERKSKVQNALDKFTPTDEYTHALQFLAQGGAINLESAKNETGLSAKEVKWATRSKNKYKKDSELKPIEATAEDIVANSSQDLDVQEVRNALIDLVSNKEGANNIENEVVDIVESEQKTTEEEELYAYLGSLSEKDLSLYESIKAEDDYISELTDNQVEDYYNSKINEYERTNPKAEQIKERGKDIIEGNDGKKEPTIKEGSIESLTKRLEALKAELDGIKEDNSRSGVPVIKAKQAKKIIEFLSKKYGIEAALVNMGAFSVYGRFNTETLKIEINSQTTLDNNGNLSIYDDLGNVSRRTIFHEFLHPFVEILEDSNPDLYNEIFNKAVEANKKDNFTDISHYDNFKQKEELVVRYLDRLSDSDKLPTVFQKFINWLSDLFFTKRKNDKTTLQNLTKDTTVEELYDIFKNYGNIKDEIIPVIKKSNVVSELNHAKELLKLAISEKLPKENIDFYAKSVEDLENSLNLFNTSRRQQILDEIKRTEDRINELKSKSNPDDVKAKLNPEKPKSEKVSNEDFRDKIKSLPHSEEFAKYMSGETIAKVQGVDQKDLRNDQTIEVFILDQAGNHGIETIEMAKDKFGAKYVEKTLQYLSQANLQPHEKGVIYVSLENEMHNRVTENPSVAEKKLQDLVQAKSQAHLRSSSLSTGSGRLRSIMKDGYITDGITDQMYSPAQLEDKKKLQKAIEADMDAINKEAEERESDFEIKPPKIRRSENIVKLEIADTLKKMRADLLRVAKGDMALASIPYAAQLKAAAPHIIKLSKLFAELGGMKTRAIINEIHKQIKDIFPEINKQDISDILEVKNTPVPRAKVDQKAKAAKEFVKQALIEKGFGREITVTVNQKDAQGNILKDEKGRNKKIKEKRNVLDWKKLAGEAGTIENIRENVNEVLKEKGYTDKEIESMSKEYEKEYNDLREGIIEKSFTEILRRNAPAKKVDVKSSAKRLAEMYNYGMFEQNPEEFRKLINSSLGFDNFDEAVFKKLEGLAKSIVGLYATKYSELELQPALADINKQISRTVTKASYSKSMTKFKLATIIEEFQNLGTRMLLVSLRQLTQNPISGYMGRATTNIAYTFNKTDNKVLRGQRNKIGWNYFKNIILNGGLDYGDVSTLLVNDSMLVNTLNNSTESEVLHAGVSAYFGKPFLEAYDSLHKVNMTEKYFNHNLIMILTDLSNPLRMSKKDALNFVTEKLTGQSFENALVKAREITEKTNADAGRKVLKTNQRSIEVFAQAIMKSSLLEGNILTKDQIGAAYNAAYKAAGGDLGHIPNNPLSIAVAGYNSKVEDALQKAIKENNWTRSTVKKLERMLSRNLLNVFANGGTNWYVLTAEYTPLGVISLLAKKGMKMGKMDLTSVEGMKNIEEKLYWDLQYKSTLARMMVGVTTNILIATASVAAGFDDDLDEWMKRNEWAKPYFTLLGPTGLVALLAWKNNDMEGYIKNMVNAKSEFFDINYKAARSIIDLMSDKPNKGAEAGKLIGSYTSIPAPIRLIEQTRDVTRGLMGKEVKKKSYKASGFVNGLFMDGVLNFTGNRPGELQEDVEFRQLMIDNATPTKPKTEEEKLEKQIKPYKELEDLEKRRIEYNKRHPNAQIEQIVPSKGTQKMLNNK